MSIAFEALVSPEAYDDLLYEVVHSVLDRTIELASKADTVQVPSEPAEEEKDSESEGFVSLIMSQANFTPSERAEFQSTGMLLNLLISTAVARRSGLYTDNSTES